MARVVQKPLSISAINPVVRSTNGYTNFVFMGECGVCGFSPLVNIKDSELANVVKKFCSGCNTEWVR